jgi:hypothetical protein
MERIRLILSGDLKTKDNRYIIKNKPPDGAVDELVKKMQEDGLFKGIMGKE